eukprot:INCI18880.1.p2 GENE.INCI18880.1~~INCI18880.1.p2  ORF type:complete len:139 (+),score=14.10 INCI18880.1:183-599(+)
MQPVLDRLQFSSKKSAPRFDTPEALRIHSTTTMKLFAVTSALFMAAVHQTRASVYCVCGDDPYGGATNVCDYGCLPFGAPCSICAQMCEADGGVMTQCTSGCSPAGSGDCTKKVVSPSDGNTLLFKWQNVSHLVGRKH